MILTTSKKITCRPMLTILHLDSSEVNFSAYDVRLPAVVMLSYINLFPLSVVK